MENGKESTVGLCEDGYDDVCKDCRCAEEDEGHEFDEYLDQTIARITDKYVSMCINRHESDDVTDEMTDEFMEDHEPAISAEIRIVMDIVFG